MNQTIEKFIARFPNKEKVIREIWKVRKDCGIIDKCIGKTKHGEVWFTTDPEKMLMCGASIKSSYSPDSKSFDYLPTLVLQPYIGMIYIAYDENWGLDTTAGMIVAPKYKCRAFVMHENGNILAKFPTYEEPNKFLFDPLKMFEPEKKFVAITSNTPPVEIHLDCMDLWHHKDGHVATYGQYINPQELVDEYYKGFKGAK